MTKNELSFPIFFGIAVAIGILIGSYFDFENKLALFKNSKEEKIKKLIGYIQYNYIEEVATDSLLDDAIKNIVSKLDPHSYYISKEEQALASENMNGEFVGIGINFMILNDTVVVSNIIEDSPSSFAGLKRGDRIISANQQRLFKEDLISKDPKSEQKTITSTIVDALKGVVGSEVSLEVYRKTSGKKLNIPVKRAPVTIKSISGYYMINPQLGYINIRRFSKNTAVEFNAALCNLIDEGMTSLVLDLRGNPGGYIGVAERIADEFLEKGRLIFSTKNSKGEEAKAFATDYGDFKQGELYILIDRNSASSSEVVAGTLQDNDRSLIIGRRSFGKALVQEEMDLGDGSVVRLTTSQYFTVSGRSIQKPFDKSKPHDDYFKETTNRITSGELLSKELIEVDEKQAFSTFKGRKVYGGSGIIPDVFIPLNKFEIDQLTTGYHRKIKNFTLRYLDDERAHFEKINQQDFIANYRIEETVLEECIKELGFDFTYQNHKKQKLEIAIKSILARNIFNETAYFKVSHTEDKMMNKVIEIHTKKQTKQAF
jgi:carboxyl-terminal processing protease